MSRPWIVFAALWLATGCQNGGTSGPATIRLGYFANLTHAQAVLAVESGDLAAAIAPARLQTRLFNAGPSLVEALFGGEIDVGYIGPGPAISAHSRSRGRGVLVVAGAAANGALIVARRDAGIERVADLAGKKIATPQLGNTQDISAKHFVTHVLRQADTSGIIPIPNAEQAAMMTRGEIDAAWAPEPWASRLVNEAGAKVIAEEKDLAELWPTRELALTVVIATPEFLKERGELLRRLLRVHRTWTARLQREPMKQVPALEAALEKLTGKTLPAGVMAQAIRHVKFTDDPLEQTLQTFNAWTHELGFSRQIVPLAGLVNLTPLRDEAR
jgi:NitT/TauT family transport system substrate-binding protein